jgi:hypothetical protein
MGNPGSISAAVPYGEDHIARRQQDLETRVREEAASRRLARSQIGAGGVIKVDGTLQVTGDLEIPAGALSSAGSMSAGATVTAGTDVHAGDDLIADDDLIVGGDATIGGNLSLGGDVYSPHGRATPVTSGYVSAWFNVDGRLGATASATRFKQDIEPADMGPLIAALRQVQLYRFRYRAAVAEMGDAAPLELGSLAEHFIEIGLGEYVYRDADGEVLGINYERLTSPLLAAWQSVDERVAHLESGA